jgi:hypothetical protein
MPPPQPGTRVPKALQRPHQRVPTSRLNDHGRVSGTHRLDGHIDHPRRRADSPPMIAELIASIGSVKRQTKR